MKGLLEVLVTELRCRLGAHPWGPVRWFNGGRVQDCQRCELRRWYP